MTDLFLIHLKNVPIFEQLKLEEALLRTQPHNYCLINEGSPLAIVMGISGKEDELIDRQKVKKAEIPVIKRFSGGGTVIVDESTFFVSFLFQKEVFDFPPFPEQILQWSAEFYKNALKILDFGLKENDYTIGNLKCGGNAQYLKKDRWLHHTTFLWDYQENNMDYLLHPKKIPKYREDRSHNEFLCKLKPHISSLEEFSKKIRAQLKQSFNLQILSLEEAKKSLDKEYRKTTHLIEL